MISVAVVLAFLTIAGALTIVALGRIERATLVLAELRPAAWRDVSARMGDATEELSLRISDRIDR